MTEENDTLTKAALEKALLKLIHQKNFKFPEIYQLKQIIQVFFDTIADALQHGKDVKLSSFGSFQLKDKSERPGRNPKTGERFPVSARRVVVFHPSPKLRRAVDANEKEDLDH